jgi:hypothetical protein
MRKRARTVLCGGRSAMVVPTASTGSNRLQTSQKRVFAPESIQLFDSMRSRAQALNLGWDSRSLPD